jgi:hypothetical protein
MSMSMNVRLSPNDSFWVFRDRVKVVHLRTFRLAVDLTAR